MARAVRSLEAPHAAHSSTPLSLARPCCLPARSAPSAFHSLAAHLTTTLFLLGDAADSLADASGTAAAAVDAASNAASAVADAAPAAAEEAAKNSGFFGAFAGAFEAFLKVLDDGLEKVGVPYRCAAHGLNGCLVLCGMVHCVWGGALLPCVASHAACLPPCPAAMALPSSC